MTAPLQITVRDMSHSPAIDDAIRKKADKLERFYDRITSCHVLVEAAHRHHHQGKHYQVRIDIMVPGAELAITRDPSGDGSHEDVFVAIRDAFDAARRRLQEFRRRERGETKPRDTAHEARILRLFPAQEYGFLRTPDNREIYFHANCLRDLDFSRLDPGTGVVYAEEEGLEGPQAIWVASGGSSIPE